MKKTVLSAMLLTLISVGAKAQQKDSNKIHSLDEVVITDTKFAQSKEKSGKVIEVISADDLKKKMGQSLANVLNQVAGVEINGNQSANGKNLGYYIRGGKNQQVLILIDGVPVTDASGISFEFDLRLLPVDQVERIEIMKGASSTLYGTGAATAVINITLKKSGKKPLQGNAYINIGSNNTATNHVYNGQDFNQGFSVSGTVKKVNYLASLNSTETDGMSQIAEPTPNLHYENDRFSRLNYMTKIGVKATEKLTLDFFGNFDKTLTHFDFDYDASGFSDTNLNTAKSEQFRFGFSPKYYYSNGEFVLNSGFTKINREYNEYGLTKYDSKNVSLDAVNKYKINSDFFIVTGANYQFYDMGLESLYGNLAPETTKFNMIDPYFTGVFTSKFGLNINAGTRLNIHSQYGNHWVYNINPSFHFGKDIPLKILSSLSTAFVTPSLYQLYSEYGNTALTPEKNKTAEIGFEAQFLDKKLTFNTVGFYREQTNSIGFLASKYNNVVGFNKAKGIEMSFNYAVNDKLNLNGNYTFTQMDEAINRLIPKNKVNASVDYSPTKRLFFNMNYQFVDSRKDVFFNGNTYTLNNAQLNSYQLFNVLAKYELIENRLTLFGSVTNIFNEKFVENIGYSTRGRNFKIGLNILL